SKGYGMTGFRLELNPVYTGRTNLPLPQLNPAASTINGVKTVFIILMENQNWSVIKGSAECPYINQTLLPMASYCERYYNPRGLHPSEPNYLWLVSGTNFGVHDDNPPSANHQSSTETLFEQMDQAGVSWRTYQENYAGGFVPDTDNYPYAVRHNPFVFFDAVRTNLAYCTNHVRPYTELAGDLARDTVACFNFITPNITNDMHDVVSGCTSCSALTQGDTWLSHEVPKILASPAYTNGGGLFITFDEGLGTSDGPIAMIVLSPRAKGGGYFNSQSYTHSSTLRTFQDIFGLGPYLRDAAYATGLDDLFLAIQLVSPVWSGNTFSLVATNLVPGQTNYLQVSEDLSGTNWVTLQTLVATRTWEPVQDVPPAGAKQRFYRVRTRP
ncbi:MAG: hypothetical protein NTW03_11270, partial [Verrucomicrobia bacterium]|nr:hypothetical protein [Verrucomicrobiota bacterium]